jgi:major membrane immunogen (membrane-anchored lipoprotein)
MLDIALPAGDYTLRLVDKNNKDKTRSVKITINSGKVTRHRFVLE